MSTSVARAAQVRAFFCRSELLEYMVLRPLDHIRPGWELLWDDDNDCYLDEPNTYAGPLNALIDQLCLADPPKRYHDHEDRLAEYVRTRLKWRISKKGKIWVGANYEAILEQGGFDDIDQGDLVLAATGRVWAAIDRGQTTFEEMHDSHRRMLGAVLSIILYHRY